MAKKITDKDVLKAKEVFKDLSGRQKLEYIWEYYKIHILASLVVVVLTGQFVYVTFINPPPKIGFMISFINQYISSTDAPREQLQQALAPILLEDTEKFKIELIDFVLSDSDPQYQDAMVQKFTAMISAREIDVIICNEMEFYVYTELGFFADLSMVEGLDISEYKKYSAISSSNEDTEERIYGVYIDMDGIMSGTTIESSGVLMGIVPNTERLDAAARLVDAIAAKE